MENILALAGYALVGILALIAVVKNKERRQLWSIVVWIGAATVITIFMSPWWFIAYFLLLAASDLDFKVNAYGQSAAGFCLFVFLTSLTESPLLAGIVILVAAWWFLFRVW